jgi:hypothetical protein
MIVSPPYDKREFMMYPSKNVRGTDRWDAFKAFSTRLL